eukprot:TRINITY_DN42309_c0_g1_i1.p2 TRINITY_DN42309_c0_g1~~TRINITY_DN42309_c0_g1_i1.p2  ORF type:complete len:174 (+),score=23.29 TRINITY_DN42309_c0_g1_i1:162-683(+)
MLPSKQFKLNDSIYDSYFLSINNSSDFLGNSIEPVQKNRNRSRSSNFDEKQLSIQYEADYQKPFDNEFELYYDNFYKQNYKKFKNYTRFKQFPQIKELNQINEQQQDCEIVSIDDEPELQYERLSSNLIKRVKDSLGKSQQLVKKINYILERERGESSFVLGNQSDGQTKQQL